MIFRAFAPQGAADLEGKVMLISVPMPHWDTLALN